MVTISRDEIKKIAQMSNIALPEDEIDSITHHVSAVLSYAQRVKEIAQNTPEELDKNTNVMRHDMVAPSDPQTILAQAAEREADYFVVPAIIESK